MSAPAPSSVLQKVKLSIATILTNKTGLRFLKAFASRNHCEAGLFFWLDVEKFRRLKSGRELKKLAVEIWEVYLRPYAELQLRAPAALVKEVNKRIITSDIDNFVFNALQEDVLKNDISVRITPHFMQSAEYTDLTTALIRELLETGAKDGKRGWGISMDELLANPLGMQVFRQYLASLKMEQALDFHLSVNSFRRRYLSPDERLRDAVFIFKRFIHPKSKTCTIHRPELQKSIAASMKTPAADVFDEARDFVLEGLRDHIYPRFQRSELFQEAVRSIEDFERGRVADEERQQLRDQQKEAHRRYKALLFRGALFIKHGPSHNAHWKFVRVSEDGLLFWSDPDSLERAKSISVTDITHVLQGKESEQFNRKSAQHVSPSLCFSIVTPTKSLDLQCSEEATRAEWLSALRWFIEKRKRRAGLSSLASTTETDGGPAPSMASDEFAAERRTRPGSRAPSYEEPEPLEEGAPTHYATDTSVDMDAPPPDDVPPDTDSTELGPDSARSPNSADRENERASAYFRQDSGGSADESPHRHRHAPPSAAADMEPPSDESDHDTAGSNPDDEEEDGPPEEPLEEEEEEDLRAPRGRHHRDRTIPAEWAEQPPDSPYRPEEKVDDGDSRRSGSAPSSHPASSRTASRRAHAMTLQPAEVTRLSHVLHPSGSSPGTGSGSASGSVPSGSGSPRSERDRERAERAQRRAPVSASRPRRDIASSSSTPAFSERARRAHEDPSGHRSVSSLSLDEAAEPNGPTYMQTQALHSPTGSVASMNSVGSAGSAPATAPIPRHHNWPAYAGSQAQPLTPASVPAPHSPRRGSSRHSRDPFPPFPPRTAQRAAAAGLHDLRSRSPAPEEDEEELAEDQVPEVPEQEEEAEQGSDPEQDDYNSGLNHTAPLPLSTTSGARSNALSLLDQPPPFDSPHSLMAPSADSPSSSRLTPPPPPPPSHLDRVAGLSLRVEPPPAFNAAAYEGSPSSVQSNSPGSGRRTRKIGREVEPSLRIHVDTAYPHGAQDYPDSASGSGSGDADRASPETTSPIPDPEDHRNMSPLPDSIGWQGVSVPRPKTRGGPDHSPDSASPRPEMLSVERAHSADPGSNSPSAPETPLTGSPQASPDDGQPSTPQGPRKVRRGSSGGPSVTPGGPLDMSSHSAHTDHPAQETIRRAQTVGVTPSEPLVRTPLKRKPSGPSVGMVKDGFLFKRTETSLVRRWVKRYFVLQARCFMHYNDKNSEKESGKVHLKDVISVNHCADKDKGRRFEVICKATANGGNRNYVLCAEDRDAAKQWAMAISAAVLKVQHQAALSLAADPFTHSPSSPAIRKGFSAPGATSQAPSAPSLDAASFAARKARLQARNVHTMSTTDPTGLAGPEHSVASDDSDSRLKFTLTPDQRPRTVKVTSTVARGHLASVFDQLDQPSASGTKNEPVRRTFSGRLLRTQSLSSISTSVVQPPVFSALQQRLFSMLRQSNLSQRHPLVFQHIALPLLRSDHNIILFILETLIQPNKGTHDVYAPESPHSPVHALVPRVTGGSVAPGRGSTLDVQTRNPSATVSMAPGSLSLTVSGPKQLAGPFASASDKHRSFDFSDRSVTRKCAVVYCREPVFPGATHCLVHQNSRELSHPNARGAEECLHRLRALGATLRRGSSMRKSKKGLAVQSPNAAQGLEIAMQMGQIIGGSAANPRRATASLASSTGYEPSASSMASDTLTASASQNSVASTSSAGDEDSTSREESASTLERKQSDSLISISEEPDPHAAQPKPVSPEHDFKCIACERASKVFARDVCRAAVSGPQFSPLVKHALIFMLVNDVQLWYHPESYVAVFNQPVQNTAVWPGLFAAMIRANLKERNKALTDITVLLVKSYHNRDSILAHEGWQEWVLPLLQDIPTDVSLHRPEERSVFTFVMNILVMLLSRLFMKDDTFFPTLLTVMRTFQTWWDQTAVSLDYSRILLRSLIIELTSHKKNFNDLDREVPAWRNLLELLRALKLFVFATPATADGGPVSPPHAARSLADVYQTPKGTTRRLASHLIRFGDVCSFGIHSGPSGASLDKELVEKASALLKALSVGNLESYLQNQPNVTPQERQYLLRTEEEAVFLRDTSQFLQTMERAGHLLPVNFVAQMTERFHSCSDAKARSKFLVELGKRDELVFRGRAGSQPMLSVPTLSHISVPSDPTSPHTPSPSTPNAVITPRDAQGKPMSGMLR